MRAAIRQVLTVQTPLDWWRIGPAYWPRWKSVLGNGGAAGVDAGRTTVTGVTTGGWSCITYSDGRVFIAGQISPSQIYDPATGTTVTIPGLNVGHISICQMPDGRLFFCGYSTTPQIYNPATGAVTNPTGVSSGKYSACLTTDQRIFCNPWSGAAQIYDPATDSATTATGVPTGMSGCCPMADGRIFCQAINGTHKIYDPATDTAVTATGVVGGYGCAQLTDLRILTAGEYTSIYDPATGTVSAILFSGTFVNVRRLPDGRLLCCGLSVASRIYDPVTGTSIIPSGATAGDFGAAQLFS